MRALTGAGASASLVCRSTVAGPFHLIRTLAYAHSSDVGYRTGSSCVVYDYQWVLATAGAELEYGRTATTFAVGGELGAAWWRTPRQGQVGTPPVDPCYGGDARAPCSGVHVGRAGEWRSCSPLRCSFAALPS